MRYDEDFMYFITKSQYYTFDFEHGYTPTKDAPQDVIDAIERFKKNCEFRKKMGKKY